MFKIRESFLIGARDRLTQSVSSHPWQAMIAAAALSVIALTLLSGSTRRKRLSGEATSWPMPTKPDATDPRITAEAMEPI